MIIGNRKDKKRYFKKKKRDNTLKQNIIDALKLKRRPIKENGIIGVYFLFKNGNIVYVGQSVNIHRRIQEHVSNPEKDFDEYSFIQCSKKALDNLESAYIYKYQPEYNKSGLY